MGNQEVKKMKPKKVVSICLSGGSIPEGKHITLQYKPSKEDLPDLLQRLGEAVSFSQGPILQGLGVVTVVCNLDEEDLYAGESLPHVTMECLDGVSPNESNTLISEYVEQNGEFKKKDFNAGFIAYISAMYYSKEGKSYSTSTTDWEV
jgi:hypothetical protein